MFSRWRERRANAKLDASRRKAAEEAVHAQGEKFAAAFSIDPSATAALDASLMDPAALATARAAYERAIADGADHAHAVAAAEAAYDSATDAALDAFVETIEETVEEAIEGGWADDALMADLEGVATVTMDQAIGEGANLATVFVDAELQPLERGSRVLSAVAALGRLAPPKELPKYLRGAQLLGSERNRMLKQLVPAVYGDHFGAPALRAIRQALVDHCEASLRLGAAMVLYSVVAGTYPKPGPSDKAKRSLALKGLLPPTWEQRATTLDALRR